MFLGSPLSELTLYRRKLAWVPVWSQIELDMGIVAASLPALSPLLKKVWSGFSPPRAATPSQMSTLPGYRESWGEKSIIDRDLEKGQGGKEIGVSDVEAAVEKEMGVVKSESTRVTTEEVVPKRV